MSTDELSDLAEGAELGVGGRSEKEAVVVVVEDEEEVVVEEVVEVVLVVEAVEVKRKRDPKFSLRRRPGSAKTK